MWDYVTIYLPTYLKFSPPTAFGNDKQPWYENLCIYLLYQNNILYGLSLEVTLLVSIHPTPLSPFTLCGERDLEDVIKLRILRWKDTPGLRRWVWSHHKGPLRGGQEGLSERRCGEGSAGQSDTARSQGVQTGSRSRKRQGMDSPLEQPRWHLDLSPVSLILNFWLPDSQRINWCCFKSLCVVIC